MKAAVPLITLAFYGCASSTFYYPSEHEVDNKGFVHVRNHKALQLYGDTYGATSVRITRNSTEFHATGGIDNSIVTDKIFDTAGSVAKWTIGWGFSYGILNSFFGHAGAAYNTNQAASVTNAKTAAKFGAAKSASASKLPTVGSTIPAQTQATVTVPQAAPAALPAAGSTIQSTIPAVVTPAP